MEGVRQVWRLQHGAGGCAPVPAGGHAWLYRCWHMLAYGDGMWFACGAWGTCAASAAPGAAGRASHSPGTRYLRYTGICPGRKSTCRYICVPVSFSSLSAVVHTFRFTPTCVYAFSTKARGFDNNKLLPGYIIPLNRIWPSLLAMIEAGQRVAIIGSGISGISAAYLLHKCVCQLRSLLTLYSSAIERCGFPSIHPAGAAPV